MKAWTEQGCQAVLRCPPPTPRGLSFHMYISPTTHQDWFLQGWSSFESDVSHLVPHVCVFFFLIRNTSFKNLFWLHHTACEQGLNLRPRQWECEVLTNGPWGNSLHFWFFFNRTLFHYSKHIVICSWKNIFELRALEQLQDNIYAPKL